MTSVVLYAGTVINNSSAGSKAWVSPSNAQGNPSTNITNGTYSYSPVNTKKPSQYLWATNFGAAIPSGATINGIQVDIFDRQDSTSAIDLTVQLIFAGSLVGSNLSAGASLTSASSGATDMTYGGSTNLWGTTPAYSDINNVNFGVAYQATETVSTKTNVAVYGIQVTVFYKSSASTLFRRNRNRRTGSRTVCTYRPAVVDRWRRAFGFHDAVSQKLGGVAL